MNLQEDMTIIVAITKEIEIKTEERESLRGKIDIAMTRKSDLSKTNK